MFKYFISTLHYIAAALLCSFAAFLIISAVKGNRIFLVQTGSMSPTIPPGSVIYVVPTEFERLSENDIITFSTGNSTVTHRIVSIDENNRSLVTKGDGNNLIDANPVPYDKVIGKVMFSNKYLGRIGLYQIRYLLLILAGIIVMKDSLRRISSADDT